MSEIASKYGSDWLALYHSNANLVGFNPHRLPDSAVLRIGVSYHIGPYDAYDGLPVVANRFLISEDLVRMLNPELTADVALTAHSKTSAVDLHRRPDRPTKVGGSIELRLDFSLRRGMLPGETVRVPLPFVHGSAWEGKVPETCDSPRVVWSEAGTPEAMIPNPCVGVLPGMPCGEGFAGWCSYNELGHIGCSLPVCEEGDGGEHEDFAKAVWEEDAQMLALVIKRPLPAVSNPQGALELFMRMRTSALMLI